MDLVNDCDCKPVSMKVHREELVCDVFKRGIRSKQRLLE